MSRAGRTIGRAIGPLAAMLLGAAGGFLAWALPASLLGAAMRHLHILAVLPQAAPPYSPLTRIGLAAAVGIVLAAIVLLGFRRLETGRWPWAREAEPEIVEEAMPLPRLRRVDRHPDAPARRPLSAAELAEEPLFPEKAEAEPLGLTPPPIAPTILRAPLFAEAAPVQPEPIKPEPVRPIKVPEPVAVEPAPVEPAPVEPAPTAAAVPEPVAPAQPPAEHFASPPVLPRESRASIADLMTRLEAGLARHDRPPAASEPELPLGDALRDALADLQKMARR